ncbi:hypothetical protein GCM10023093_27220 [Nemorincola caseinilytica]|uniref:Glycosyltransferase RgtA/B/C/D-like domain-containing protein n=1 Tax=Nemorincola caseinilytica TaxID=2054315 RepID=A0ABP8NKK2_9BACT
MLLWVVLYIIFPWYRYYIDPDGTSYLTISQRYADGDISTAVNGLWSPWACWLTALLIKAGMQAVPASVVVNAAGATGFLWASWSLFVRFGVPVARQWVYCMAMVVFLCFAVFWQSFDDLWGCFLMLCVLRMMLAQGFARRPALWAGIGMVGALAFFAKAYSLPYFVLCVGVGTFFLAERNRLQWLRIMLVAVPVMLACCFPWVYMLHTKYGIWTTSTAGALNMSWYLVGHPEWKTGIDILVPPIHSGSVYYWEDPYYVNGHLSHYWDSWHLAGLQVLRLGYNCLMLLRCMAEISVLLPMIGAYILVQFLKKFRTLSGDMAAMYLFFLLLPAGYVMVHLESRYLWLMLPIGMVVAWHAEIDGVARKYLQPLFIASIVVFPLWQLRAMCNEGRAEYEFAQRLNAAGIKGADIVSDLHPRLLSKMMYFSGNRFYVISKQRPEPKEDKAANTARLVQDIKRYRITYYLHSPKGNGKLRNPGFDEIFHDNLSDGVSPIPYEKVMTDTASGIILYKLPQQ